jgi:subtilisin family serine protease
MTQMTRIFSITLIDPEKFAEVFLDSIPAGRRLGSIMACLFRFRFFSPCSDATTATGVILIVCLLPLAVLAGKDTTPTVRGSYRPDRILIQPKAGTTLAALTNFRIRHGLGVLHDFDGLGIQVLAVPNTETVPGLIEEYRRSRLVEYAEPDFIRSTAWTEPNDPKYLDGTLWALHNYGQSGGTLGADIDAPEGWDILTSASNIVVAVVDSGIRYTHEDLASNMWVNPMDRSHGWNTLTGTNTPVDIQGHGTLVAGVLGGVGNNGKGVAGVAWQVQLMALACFDANENASDSDIITCLEYARTNGARIVNASWGDYAYSQSLSNAFYRLGQDGIIVVAAAGNNIKNIDLTPYYPACYELDNILSVAYTTRNDALGALSNYGATNVDLAAPGAAMYSTFFAADNSYLPQPYAPYLEGTSFAAPYVSGALALLLAKYPDDDYHQTIARLLNSVDLVLGLAGKCRTGGRLNLRNAFHPPIRLASMGFTPDGFFQLRVSCGPNQTVIIQAAPDLANWSPVFTNTSSSTGTLEFTDTVSGTLSRHFYRAAGSP